MSTEPGTVQDRLAHLWQDTYLAVGTNECAPIMSAWLKAIEGDPGLPEDTVLAICLPTLRMEVGTTLGFVVVRVAPRTVAKKIYDDLAPHKMGRAGAKL